MARISVLLPVPDSPTTSTLSPASIATSVSPHDGGAVVEGDGDARGVAGPAPRLLDPVDAPGSRLLGALQPVERDDEPGDAVRGGCPVGELGIVLDEPVEGLLHGDEGATRPA